MSNNWQQEYKRLTDFIAQRPSIKLSKSLIQIPENVRSEFYRLFDTVRFSFIEEKFSDLLNEATTLSQNYTKSEHEVTRLLFCSGVSTSPSLYRFLHNPTDGLKRILRDPLFNLLEEKVDIETFDKEASRTIMATFRKLYPSGYEKWVALSLIKLLEADRRLQVSAPSTKSLGDEDDEELAVLTTQDSRYLSFNREWELHSMVPDFVVHSAKVNKFVSLRSEVRMANRIADKSEASETREWHSLTPIIEKYGSLLLSLDFMVIYVDTQPEHIALIADTVKICRPDLVIECRGQEDWYKKEELEKVKLRHNILNPTLGTYIVSREHVPEQAYKELMPEEVSEEPAPEQVSKKPILEQTSEEPTWGEEQKPTPEQEPEKRGEGIHILTVGFDQTKLEPIISVLMQPESKD